MKPALCVVSNYQWIWAQTQTIRIGPLQNGKIILPFTEKRKETSLSQANETTTRFKSHNT